MGDKKCIVFFIKDSIQDKGVIQKEVKSGKIIFTKKTDIKVSEFLQNFTEDLD